MQENKAGKKLSTPLPVLLAAAFVLVFCAVFNSLVFERVPHVHDEIAYLFQAKIFASGRLYAPSPCARESFDFPHLINNGRWYSIYPPGFPFLLMLGLRIGAPWLVNPLLAALSIILFYYLGREIYDRKTGILAAVLGATSIWLLLMSSTMMSHTASMLFNALFLFFAFRSFRSPTAAHGILAGTSFGLAFLLRPYNAVLFALPLVALLGVGLWREPRKRMKNFLSFAGSAAVFVSLLLAYNFLTNGHPLKMGYTTLYGKSYTVIFGRPATLDYEFTPLFGAAQLLANLRALNSDLFGWPGSSFLAFLPLIWLIARDPEEKKRAFLLLSLFLAFLAGFSFFWGAFPLIGARMFFDMVPIFVLLSARGLLSLPELLRSITSTPHNFALSKILIGIFVFFVAHGFFIRFPRLIRPPGAGWHYDVYDCSFAGTTARLHRSLQNLDLQNAVVLLKFLNEPVPGFPSGQWGSGFIQNDIALKGKIIYALDRGSRNSELFPCFQGRKFYYYWGILEKGLLVPIRKDADRILAGEPLYPPSPCEKCTKLLPSPDEIFTPYSAEFEEFVSALIKEKDFLDLDVSRLFQLGLDYRRAGDNVRAAFCFEAGLQIENNPEPRRQLLNSLAASYLKTGRTEEARKIMEILNRASIDGRGLYRIFPEKGF